MLAQTFDGTLVGVSIAIAVLASYAALAFSGRVHATQGATRFAWLFGGGAVMGLGIAAMHFIGMLAMTIGVPVAYEPMRTVGSVLLAVIASTAALAIGGSTTLRAPRLIAGATMAGFAVAGMHYLGMSAMRGSFVVAHDPTRVTISVVIAISAAAATLWLAFHGDDNPGARGALLRTASAGAMGLAVAGMHYTAMSAAHFTATVSPGALVNGPLIHRQYLGAIVASTCAVLLTMAIIIAMADRRARRAARDLSVDADRYRQMAEALPGIVWTATAAGAIDYCNTGWFEYSGLTLELSEGMAWLSAVHSEDVAHTLDRWTQAVATGETYEIEYRLRRHDNEYRWHLGRGIPLRDSHERIIKWLGTATDIHEQKRAETQLREGQSALEDRVASGEAKAMAATELYRLLAENATDMVSTHFPDGGFDYATPSWSEYTGIPADGIKGLFPAAISHADDLRLLVWNYRRALQLNELTTTIWRCRRADGSFGWLETTTRAVRDDAGALRAFVCATRDITERRRLEEELEVVNGVVLAASTAPNLETALDATLRQLCHATGWSYGEVWFPVADGSVLERSTSWYAPDMDAASGLAETSAGMRLAPGEGSPGKAWQSREVVWIPDFAADKENPRAAVAIATGFNAAIAVPVMERDSVVAVLVFFLDARRDDDERKIGLLTIAAAQLSALIMRKRVEQSLADERRFLAALLDNMSESIVACDAAGRLTLFNRAARRMHGLDAADVPPEQWAQHYSVFLADGTTPIPVDQMPLNRVLRGEPVRDQEWVLAARGQMRRTLSANAVTIVDDNGAKLGAVVASRDITDWKLAQEALDRSDQRFRAASNSGLDSFAILDAVRNRHCEIDDFLYADVNASAASWLSRSRDDIVGRRMSELYPEPLMRRFLDRYAQVVERQTPLQEEIEIDEPGLFTGWIHYQVVPLNDGVAVTSRDISTRKAIELAIHESEARYRQLVEQAADAILIVAPDGRCVEANARACALLDRAEVDIIGRPARMFFAANETSLGSPFSTLGVGDVATAEDWVIRENEIRVPVEISVAVLPGLRTQIIARDISGRKELERLKDEFISIVSHELRTPLTSIRGALGLLASGRLAGAPEKSQRMLDLAVSNTDRLIRLINDILDAERIESGTTPMERMWVAGLEIAHQVAEVLRPVADRAGVEIRVSGSPVRVWADADRLTQTLTNLVGNAIKFSPEASAIEVEVTTADDGARFEVRDKGRGIPADKLEKIFERFQQVDASDAREKGGSGLGLAISRSIVRQHGGRIWVESTLGQGSSFCFTLPAPNAALPAAPRRASSGAVLLCDDDPHFLEVVREMLERRGLTVDTVRSGRQAVEYARVERPIAILLDVAMPGISGRETLALLRSHENTRDIPVVLVSGATPRGESSTIGAADWLSKPVDEHTLVDALQRILMPSEERPRILLVEDDVALSQVIAATLETRGYSVTVAHSGADALTQFQSVGAQAIIVDLGLPDMSGLSVLEWIQTGSVSIPAIMYTAADLDASLRDRVRETGAVIATKSRTSPDDLVDQVTKMLEQSSRSTAAVS